VSGRDVAVFGATGHTGRFVVAELQRRGITPIAVARDGAKLGGLDLAEPGANRVASIDDSGSLDRAFADVAAVINCAGPFLDTADAIATAALRAGAHYLDVTAEQASAHATLESFDAAAREAGVIVMPAMGFYGGLGDLLVSVAMTGWNLADEILIAISLDSWHPTQGTRVTGERNTARRLVVANGRVSPLPRPAPEMTWSFPEPLGNQHVTEVPLSEVVLITRHLETRELHTYLSNVALRDLSDPNTPPPQAADASGRSAQTFVVEVICAKDGSTRRARARGRDIYAFTAPLVCEAVERILDGATAQSSGAQSPGAVFDSHAFLHALTPEHLEIEVRSD
jgi:short subunit dehydrogenase-like uncharacterized protein